MTFVLVRTMHGEDDATWYSHQWAEDIKALMMPGTYVDLSRNLARRYIVEDELIGDEKAILVFYGHGNETSLVGQDKKACVCIANCSLLKNREVYTLSCLSAKNLGVEAWRKGAIYFGYKEAFSFVTDCEEAFREAANCGFRFRYVLKLQPTEVLTKARARMTELMLKLVDQGKGMAATMMRVDRDALRYYNGEAPDTDCAFRKATLWLFGPAGWKIPSPTRWVRRYVEYSMTA